MDQKVIGAFIKNLRKEKGLTQIELAEELNVSEKTISKWECGNGLPDAVSMLPLCEQLGISANELLSGKRLQKDEYRDQAEKNLVLLQQTHQRNVKLLLTTEWVLALSSMILLFVSIFVASFVDMQVWQRVLIIVAGVILFFVGLHFCMAIEKDAGYYECQHCHHKHVPSWNAIYFAMHMGRTRYLKCPKCGKRSWQKKVVE